MKNTITAQAKINLYLHVTGKRADGYHLLDSLICFAEFGDEISVSPADDITLEITGEFGDGLSSEDNLIVKAANLLKNKYNIKQGANIKLEKNLPVGAGIGGGSADAAAAAKLLVELWDLSCINNELADLLLPLGADIPVCIHSKTSYVSGIGDIIEPLSGFPEIYMVLVNPLKHVSTPEIFQMGFDSYNEPVNHRSFDNIDQLVEFLAECSNDLESNAVKLVPEISDIIDIIKRQEGCRLSRMSGSGATCFGIFDNKANAKKASNYIRDKHPNWWVY